MNNFQSIKQLITSADNVEFADFGEGISKEWVNKAEQALNVTFPNSYKWWLENYGGGEIDGDEIFSVYGLDFDNVVGGDVVYINKLNQKNHVTNTDQLVICESFDDTFFLELSKMNNGEAPVLRLSNKQLYAKDFLEFLERRIIGE
ncbi:SMI1/KNR4 family protein [Streptococcus oricebi]|uniref:SMI1/KNR4 family protein n=1 Tax=Streptococcus oricebi TaxID=1547447 RepID=A0ABS5B305_9STRE|nr:SMI1/KNR4 family protein [Streptococcus oricebi]MBP2623221.1 SMI1/KNR4 family protein [Streptococcus oricebi]